MFQCYLDDSGTCDLPITTMAGFLAPASQWEIVESISNIILNNYGVPILHAKDFHGTRGCFEGWSGIKKTLFAQELFSSIKGRMIGFCISMRKAEFKTLQKGDRGLVDMSPYGVCFGTIMAEILVRPPLAKFARQLGIDFYIESGNKNNKGLEHYFNRMKKGGIYGDALHAIHFLEKGDCRAIQLADFLAFYGRRHNRDADRFNGKLALPANTYLEVIRRNFPLKTFVGNGIKGNLGHFTNVPEMVALNAISSVA